MTRGRYNYLGMEGATALASGLKTNRCLKYLSLAWNRIRTDGTIAIALSLHGNTSLTSLNLACNEMCAVNSFGQGLYRTDGVQALAEALPVCELRYLDVSNNALVGVVGVGYTTMGTYNNEGLGTLSDGVVGSKVKALVLDGNQIGPTGVGMLAASLARHTSLTSLYLADSNLTNNGVDLSGLSALVDSLKKQPDLKELNLDGCGIGKPGATLVCSWLKGLSELKVNKAKAGAFEHLHVERATNMLDSSDEKALREACGEDVMLHLERGRPMYAEGLEKSKGLIDQWRRRASLPDTANAAAEAAAAASGSTAGDTYLGLVATQPVAQAKGKGSPSMILADSLQHKLVPSPPQGQRRGSLPGDFKLKSGSRPRSSHPKKSPRGASEQ